MENSEKNDNKAKKAKSGNKERPKVKRSRKRLYEAVTEDTVDDVSKTTCAEKDNVKSDAGVDAGRVGVGVKDGMAKGANEIVGKYTRWGAGLSVVPIPLFDMAAIFVIQLRMLKKLADHYGVSFSEELVKSLITSLLGSLNSGAVGGVLAASALKFFPGSGLLAGMTSMCLVAGATTYAVGKVFIQHFESGGTFLNFDPEKVKEYFKKQFEDGKNIAKKPDKI